MLTKKTTFRLRKRQARQVEWKEGQKRSGSSLLRKRTKEETSSAENTKTSGTGTDTERGTDREYEAQPSTSGQNRLRLERVASAAYRTGVSRRGVALLVSAAYKDAGLVSTSDLQNVVDKGKVTRAMKKLEEKVNEGANEGVSLRGLYFDGKRDLKFTKERKGERFFPERCRGGTYLFGERAWNGIHRSRDAEVWQVR